jgi:small GTP-binding protein
MAYLFSILFFQIFPSLLFSIASRSPRLHLRMPTIKVVLIGAAHTGKTSIANRLVYGEFSSHTMPSTQPAYFQKQITYQDEDYALEIWDTAGQEQYHSLSSMFYRDADAGIIVFDLTDQASFVRCKDWVSELRTARGDSITIVVAGNKHDLTAGRQVTLDALGSLSHQIGAEVFETSAKTGENIEFMFNSLVKALSKKPIGDTNRVIMQNPKKLEFDEAPPRDPGCCG